MGGRSGGRGFSCFKCLCGRRTRHYAFLAIIIFFAGLTIHDVIELVIEYAENPTVTDIDVMMNSSIELPNITFCIDNDYIEANLPPINASAPPEEWDNLVDDALEQMPDRDSFLMNPWPWQVAKDAKAVIMSITSLEREIALKKVAKILNFYKLDGRISSLRDSWKKWEKVIDDRNVTFDEWQNKVGTELMKKVVHRFQRLAADGEKDEYRLKAGMKITWISKNEFCFQTYYTDANYAPIKTPVRKFGANNAVEGTFFEFGAHQIEAGAAINPVVIDFHGRRSTQHRAMTSGSSEKNGVNSDINPQEKHKIIGSLQAIYEILPNDDESTACVDREEDDELDDDVETCQDRCRMNMWREACHCSALTTSYLADDDDLKEYPPCHYLDCELDENATLSDADCIKGCVRGCHQVRYHVEHERQGRSAGPNGQPTGETVIEFAWENFEYLHFDQHEEWTFAKFIGELGGSIGIWLGLSVLSLIQITTYFYDFCARRVVREKILKQPSMEIAGDSELSQNPFSNPFKKRSDARKVSQVAPSNGVNAVSNSPNGSSSIDIV